MSALVPVLPRRRRRRTAVLLVAAVLASLGAGAGVSWALWSDTLANPALQVATSPKVGLTLARVGGSAQPVVAPAAQQLQLTVADGQTLISATPKAIAIPYALRMRADGHTGITYSIATPAAATGTLFAASTVRIFPLAATTDSGAQGECTPSAAPASQPSTTDVVGIATGVHTSDLATRYWCLTAVYTGAGGTYANTATAQATAASGLTASGSSTWSSFVIAATSYALTHQIRYPGGP